VVEWAERLTFAVPGALRLTLARASGGAEGGREILEMNTNDISDRRDA
jgi:hypothetical protein